MLQDIISGYDKMDATSEEYGISKLTDNLTVNAKGLKIGILRSTLEKE